MTKEEQKADELIDYYRAIVYNESLSHQRNTEIAIECAIKCVDLLINTLDEIGKSERLEFWQSVKQHILNKGK